jgi:hypothetical protein
MCRPETASDQLLDLVVALELELNHNELMFDSLLGQPSSQVSDEGIPRLQVAAWLVAVLRCCTSPGEQVASPSDELLDGLRGSAGDFLDRGGHAVIPILAM